MMGEASECWDMLGSQVTAGLDKSILGEAGECCMTYVYCELE